VTPEEAQRAGMLPARYKNRRQQTRRSHPHGIHI